ncbi:MAG TPA: GTPase, partial [Planctomycetes bacterium]|nr:GTPase [Planctomycetota bacterium]
MTERIVIMGAAGKDFHVFNTCYRGRDDARVVAFTATQIPHIEGRIYPPTLAGPDYPKGIPIFPEEELPEIIRREKVDKVIFAYSDVSYEYVAEREKIAREAGADFETAPVEEAMLPAEKPVIAVCAVRTGCGKSQTTRRVSEILKEKGLTCVVVRHPMPYGDLVKQRVQRFASVEDMEAQNCTIEEMEEYEHHIARGNVVYAGVDYEAILREAEKEADVVLWDGGNNDIPFFKPDLWITVLDPHRPGHELLYYPGKENFLRAKVLVVNKVDSADPANVEKVLANAKEYNPSALVIKANSPVTLSDPDAVRGKRVVVVEDGPTLTHGGMTYGAGTIAAEKFG